MPSFHSYRWNQFKVIPLACTVRTRRAPLPKALVYDVHTTRLHGMLHNAERCKYAWPDDVIQQLKVDWR